MKNDVIAKNNNALNTQTYNAKQQSLADYAIATKDEFLNKEIEIVDGLNFNHYDTLKRIYYYANSKFEDGDVDENGYSKYFHNISIPRSIHATKNIDIDTKDFDITSDKRNDFWKTWVLKMELRQWMKKDIDDDDNTFTKKLNMLAEDLPVFGSVVWRKTINEKGKMTVKDVDLRNLIIDPSVTNLSESRVTIYQHILSPQQMRDNPVWGDKEETKDFLSTYSDFTNKKKFLSTTNTSITSTDHPPDTGEIPVYEFWGNVPETIVAEHLNIENPVKTKERYVMAIIAIGGDNNNKVLYVTEVDKIDFPFKDVHYRKIKGRWLGLGIVESLFDLQVRANELVNRFFKGLRMGSLHLFQSKGELAQQNLLQDAQDGDILFAKHDIVPVATEMRAFAQYQTELANIENLADRIANTSEVITGEALPSATPFRLGAQLGISAQKVFLQVRENEGDFLTSIFNDWIFPELKSELKREHDVDIIGSAEELKYYADAVAKTGLLEKMKEYVLKTGYLPSTEELTEVERIIKEQMATEKQSLKVMKKYLNDISYYEVTFTATNEKLDKAVKRESLTNLLQLIVSNPTIMQDETAKRLLSQIMNLSDISPATILATVETGQQQQVDTGASPQAMAKFAQNPGDAGGGLTQESVGSSMEQQIQQ